MLHPTLLAISDTVALFGKHQGTESLAAVMVNDAANGGYGNSMKY